MMIKFHITPDYFEPCFKNSICKMPVPQREKAVLFTEFKSTILDRRYKRIKIKLLESLNDASPVVIYSCHIKKERSFPQDVKEATYIKLLSKIVSAVNEDISIIFDAFNKHDFENEIMDQISNYPNVQAIMPRNSQKEPGLQYIDNICSVIRLAKSHSDEHGFFETIKGWVKEV